MLAEQKYKVCNTCVLRKVQACVQIHECFYDRKICTRLIAQIRFLNTILE